MADREKLLKEFDYLINDFYPACTSDSYYLSVMEAVRELLKEQEAVEPFHRCIGKDFSLIEDSHFDYCPYCGKPITWAKQEGG